MEGTGEVEGNASEDEECGEEQWEVGAKSELSRPAI
jgi:hypothetical protein